MLKRILHSYDDKHRILTKYVNLYSLIYSYYCVCARVCKLSESVNMKKNKNHMAIQHGSVLRTVGTKTLSLQMFQFGHLYLFTHFSILAVKHREEEASKNCKRLFRIDWRESPFPAWECSTWCNMSNQNSSEANILHYSWVINHLDSRATLHPAILLKELVKKEGTWWTHPSGKPTPINDQSTHDP